MNLASVEQSFVALGIKSDASKIVLTTDLDIKGPDVDKIPAKVLRGGTELVMIRHVSGDRRIADGVENDLQSEPAIVPLTFRDIFFRPELRLIEEMQLGRNIVNSFPRLDESGELVHLLDVLGS